MRNSNIVDSQVQLNSSALSRPGTLRIGRLVNVVKDQLNQTRQDRSRPNYRRCGDAERFANAVITFSFANGTDAALQSGEREHKRKRLC